MHERSLVRTLVSQVEAIRQEHQATSVRQIQIQLGPLSGVEPLLVQSAFEEIASQTWSNSPELSIELVPLVIRCRVCHRESEYNQIEFMCRSCHSNDVTIIRGDEFRLATVTVG